MNESQTTEPASETPAERRALWAAAFRQDAVRARLAGSFALAASYNQTAAELEAETDAE